MDSSKTSAVLLTFMILLSSVSSIVSCDICPPSKSKPPKYKQHHKPKPPSTGKPPITMPPITVPPITVPPITVPPVIGKPPITLPPITVPPVIGKPPITLPPITVPPVIGKPPITVPPITVPPIMGKPPITVPPITVPPVMGKPPITVPPGVTPCPPRQSPPPPPTSPPASPTCPVDTLKIGACVDLLGGLVHIGAGDPAANQCCPLLQGLVEIEAAVCLCTTIKLKVLDMNVYVPLALQLLLTCGKTPPPGYTCTV
ncbi:36.4 kDa proline-rich protein-like [Musa acuminata AAA Group]|uniref:36.4 kDa proline-rich protein-like n=1 Tax=Musa acuminata AAA Group TaxID=214697 RepID=UPI0031E1F4F0